eukprot:CAMPEP_0177796422 /NCGR_PEP_ID=MMETSP0491_2-20121128/26771_1 /TAXON_ID=63592 /ORGANISM="Tetraselmis chuii, Strain PLY429" /LENGTH=484 /DNA_ID=CAMNT_0019319345 /DNA_START=165 /DNA_END=1620 /DNA_ORIENTATION=-
MVVRTCQADAGVEAQVESLLLARKEVEVGLLIGRLGNGSKDLALALVRSPNNGGEAPARCTGVAPAGGSKSRKGGGKASLAIQVSIDLDDVRAAGAADVAGRNPGDWGVPLRAESGFNQASKELASVAVECVEVGLGCDDTARNNNGREALLMHADSGSRRISMKVASADGALQPADLKFMPLLDNFVPLTCSYEVELSIPATSPAAKSVATLFEKMAAAEGGRMMCGEGMLSSGGRLPTADTPVIELLPGKGQGPSSSALQVELLCALPQSAPTHGALVGALNGRAQGLAKIKGCMHGRAYVHKRDTWSSAVDALKADLADTLQARLEMMLELEEEDCGDDNDGRPEMMSAEGLKKHFFRALPRRVGLPWVGGIMACDYLSPGDSTDDAASHGSMLLGLEGDVAVDESWEKVNETRATDGGVWVPSIRSHLTSDHNDVDVTDDDGMTRGKSASTATGFPCSMPILMGLAAASGLAMAFLVTSM